METKSGKHRERRLKAKSIVYEITGCVCLKCGQFEGDIDLLELHHIDESTKSFEVCYSNFTRSLEKIKLEAEKCIPLCPNCHRLYHLKRWDYTDLNWKLLKENQLRLLFKYMMNEHYKKSTYTFKGYIR